MYSLTITLVIIEETLNEDREFTGYTRAGSQGNDQIWQHSGLVLFYPLLHSSSIPVFQHSIVLLAFVHSVDLLMRKSPLFAKIFPGVEMCT